MKTFVFEDYGFDAKTGIANFRYSYEDGMSFEEKIFYSPPGEYDERALERALFLAFLLVGTSYFKTFPTPNVRFAKGHIDKWQADFLNKVYGEGLSQFAFENELSRSDLAQFSATTETVEFEPVAYSGQGRLVLESGGKDSLLTSVLLENQDDDFQPWYVSYGTAKHPNILDDLGTPLLTATRSIDIEKITHAMENGGLNGHVPVTYILASLAVIQAVLTGRSEVLVSIAHEGEEPHAMIGDLPVTHQWSKTWEAEQLFAEYVERYVSSDIKVGSPLRSYSELRVAELFYQYAWSDYGRRFSSCNRANYLQGADNAELKWCGECPKCANAYLLFAPFVDYEELKSLFNGKDLFKKESLQHTFKGLLGIDGIMKPFECVGEIDELRYAYHAAVNKGGYGTLSFEVPESDFDYMREYLSQSWASDSIRLL